MGGSDTGPIDPKTYTITPTTPSSRREEQLQLMKDHLLNSAKVLIAAVNKLPPDQRAPFQHLIHDMETAIHKTQGPP